MFRLLLLVVFLVSCNKIENKHLVYKINEGGHNSVVRYSPLKSDILEFTAIFDSSAIYETNNPINQLDINKLYGFSDCNSHHQTNSARFGWRWYDNSLQIFAYVYNNKVRKFGLITTVPLNTEVQYKIIITDNLYHFYVGDEHLEITRTNKCDCGFHYLLYPYFGGDETAPHDIKILIRDV